MYTLIVLETATLKKLNLKNGLNIISTYFCIDIYHERITIIPHQPGFINGDILDVETELKENDILQFGLSHFILRKTIPTIIDLTNEDDDYDDHYDDQVYSLPHEYISPGVSPNNTSYDRSEDNTPQYISPGVPPINSPYYYQREDTTPYDDNIIPNLNTSGRLTPALAAQHPDWN